MTLSRGSTLIGFPYEHYLRVLKNYIYSSPAWLQKTKEFEPSFEKWHKILGNKTYSLADIITVGNVLIVAKAYGEPLPKG